MIYICNEIPSFCPSCGKTITGFGDELARQDFFAGCSHHCPVCNAKYAYVRGSEIVALASPLRQDQRLRK